MRVTISMDQKNIMHGLTGCEAMKSSMNDVENSFDEKERLRKQIEGLKQGTEVL
jgi:hypothetical protein